MASSSVTGVVLTFTVLFFTFPLCYARLRPTSLSENVIDIGTDFPISLINSDVNPMIRLPIDQSEFQLAEIIGENETGSFQITEMMPANETGNDDLLPKKLPESETVTSATNELAEKLPEMETVTVKSIPLSLARYRPVVRPCHHSHHRHHHLFPHGGNMMVPTGENGDFNRVIIHNQLHQIPPRWSSIPYLHHHHHHYHHHDDSNNEESNSMFKRSTRFNKEKFNKHFHHHEDHHEDDEKSFSRKMKIQKLDSTKTKETGLFNRIRKMMINF